MRSSGIQVVQEEPLCNDDEFLYSMARRLSCGRGVKVAVYITIRYYYYCY